MKFCMVVLALVTAGGIGSGELLSYNSLSQPFLGHSFTDFPPHGGHGSQPFLGRCGEEEARSADGRCVKAQITKNFYVFSAPPAPKIPVGPPPYLPDPKIHYNFVFIRSPQAIRSSKPIVLPPPEQKTLVYVLSKRPGVADQEVIEVNSPPVPPEVFFVNYAPGDDTQLPGGVSLREALGRSAQQGEVIDTSAHRQNGDHFVDHKHIGGVHDSNVEQEHRGLEQIYREDVGLLSESSSLKQKRPVPYHVPSGPGETDFEAIRAPDPIEILPPAPFYPTIVHREN